MHMCQVIIGNYRTTPYFRGNITKTAIKYSLKATTQ